MAKKINDGGAAFPCVRKAKKSGAWIAVTDAGMSLRDYFAAKAMQGLCAGVMEEMRVTKRFADFAYAIADAMLVAKDTRHD